MSVHRLDDPTLRRPVQQWYFACSYCGWCSPIKSTEKAAQRSAQRHMQAKAKLP